jgi:hypothetical protein
MFKNSTLRRYGGLSLLALTIFAVLLGFALRVEPKDLHLQIPKIRQDQVVYKMGKRSSESTSIGHQAVFCSTSAYIGADDCEFLSVHRGALVRAELVILETVWGQGIFVPISLKILGGTDTKEWIQSIDEIRGRWWGNTLIDCFLMSCLLTFLVDLICSIFTTRKA